MSRGADDFARASVDRKVSQSLIVLHVMYPAHAHEVVPCSQGHEHQAQHGAKGHLDVLEDDAHKHVETSQATPQKLLEGAPHFDCH